MLKTNAESETKLVRILGCSRFVWNKTLAMNLERAFKDCFDRNQPLKRLPVFKKRGRGDGIRFPQGFKIDNRRIFLPKIGWVGFYHSRPLEGKIKNITVTQKAGRWYASIQVEQEINIGRHPSESQIGIDAGIKCFAAFSDGTLVEGPGSFRRHEDALAREQMFNVVHLGTGFKVDLIARKSRPFSKMEFSRRQAAFYLGQNRWFATAEDTILAKLEWSKMVASERQFSDALNVAKLQRDNLDRVYLEKWARELDILDLLEKLLREIE